MAQWVRPTPEGEKPFDQYSTEGWHSPGCIRDRHKYGGKCLCMHNSDKVCYCNISGACHVHGTCAGGKDCDGTCL